MKKKAKEKKRKHKWQFPKFYKWQFLLSVYWKSFKTRDAGSCKPGALTSVISSVMSQISHSYIERSNQNWVLVVFSVHVSLSRFSPGFWTQVRQKGWYIRKISLIGGIQLDIDQVTAMLFLQKRFFISPPRALRCQNINNLLMMYVTFMIVQSNQKFCPLHTIIFSAKPWGVNHGTGVVTKAFCFPNLLFPYIIVTSNSER